MKHIFLVFAISLLSFVVSAQQLRIAVAANAQFVSVKLKDAFKKETGIDAELTVSSSGKLTAQIEQGAPFNVFLSADMKYPDSLYAKGFTTEKPKIYAYGALVMWTLKDINLTKGLSAVLDKSAVKIAVANPKLAPYGEAAIQALTKENILQKIQSKIVYGESISQVNQYLLSGAADIAFTAKSVVLDTAVSGKGKWIEVNDKLYDPIAQGIVIIKTTDKAQMAMAKKFYQFIFGKTAKQIFTKYGYR